jgi:transcriptional regulator with XRE-family HTH domain
MKRPDVSETVSEAVRDIGDYIRNQRRSAEISLRQLAKLAGISNPYLSQIERGLRKPSAEILQQIARGLRISAEALYIQAGFLEKRIGGAVVDAVLADAVLSDRQKQVIVDIYESFRRDNALRTADRTGTPSPVRDSTELASTGPESTGLESTGPERATGEGPHSRAAGRGPGPAAAPLGNVGDDDLTRPADAASA